MYLSTLISYIKGFVHEYFPKQLIKATHKIPIEEPANDRNSLKLILMSVQLIDTIIDTTMSDDKRKAAVDKIWEHREVRFDILIS